MEFTIRTSPLKPRLSQMLLRTLEGQDEPKYATVPQMHSDDFRPSILEQYQYNNEVMVSQDQFSLMGKKSLGAFDHLRQSSKCSSKPLAMRTLGNSLQPLWHYCTSRIHLGIDRDTAQVVPAMEMKNFKNDDEEEFFSLKQGPTTSSKVPQSKFKTLKTKLTMKEQTSSRVKADITRPKHAFELLPPLFESHTHTLLYQNSYLLDGVTYDYETNKRNLDPSVGTKLRFNYLKFLKSVSKRTRPSDRDVVFAEAKVITKPAPQWDKSRIEWLLNLERQQELRKKQLEEERQKLRKAQENRKIFKASYFKFHKKEKDKSNDKEKAKNHKKKQPKMGTDRDMCTCAPIGK